MRTDGRTDMSKLIVALGNFPNAPKKRLVLGALPFDILSLNF